MNITLGCLTRAIWNRVRTNFSLSPTHLLVRELALILKKVADAELAIALPIIVFPVPGGPNNNIPRGGALKPVNKSGRNIGHTIISFISFFANYKPAISLHFTLFVLSKISFYIVSTNFSSSPLYLGSFIFKSSSF